MTGGGKARRAKKPSPTATEAVPEAKPRDEKAIATLCLDPSVQAADTIRRYGQISPGKLDMWGLVDALAEQVEVARQGNLGRGEAMLIAQAHVLDAVFNSCAKEATKAKLFAHFDAYLRLAFKAQSQSRATWETLVEIKNPRAVAFVRQANVTTGPQQINNGISPEQESRAREMEIEPNKLLEVTDGKRLDSRTEGAASGADTNLEAVGAINRAKDTPR